MRSPVDGAAVTMNLIWRGIDWALVVEHEKAILNFLAVCVVGMMGWHARLIVFH